MNPRSTATQEFLALADGKLSTSPYRSILVIL